MLTSNELQELKDNNVHGTNDLSTYFIDNTLPLKERFEKFIKYIENPYFFTCNNHKVKVNFLDKGFSLEQSLVNVFKSMEKQE